MSKLHSLVSFGMFVVTISPNANRNVFDMLTVCFVIILCGVLLLVCTFGVLFLVDVQAFSATFQASLRNHVWLCSNVVTLLIIVCTVCLFLLSFASDCMGLNVALTFDVFLLNVVLLCHLSTLVHHLFVIFLV